MTVLGTHTSPMDVPVDHPAAGAAAAPSRLRHRRLPPRASNPVAPAAARHDHHPAARRPRRTLPPAARQVNQRTGGPPPPSAIPPRAPMEGGRLGVERTLPIALPRRDEPPIRRAGPIPHQPPAAGVAWGGGRPAGTAAGRPRWHGEGGPKDTAAPLGVAAIAGAPRRRALPARSHAARRAPVRFLPGRWLRRAAQTCSASRARAISGAG